ncbi:TerC family protein [Planctomicrobium sp. SH664]|uniref:TerC family protein n=1 Tax=Planctomicrobium sp. SH664 TaxID=3448125 RepID=UPI003F5C51C7
MQVIISVVVLTALEIVLGIDNIIFISILCGKLPAHQREFARRLGLGAAMITRLLLLCSLKWIMGLTQPIIHLTDLGVPPSWVASGAVQAAPEIPHAQDGTAPTEIPLEGTSDNAVRPTPETETETRIVNEMDDVSVRDLILLIGGAFLVFSSIKEIRAMIHGSEDHRGVPEKISLQKVLVQIAILDIVFSLDSVITAVGLVDELWVMMAAVIAAVGVMMFFAGAVGRFVEQNPTIKVLALAFLIVIGSILVIESAGFHVGKGYPYFAMGFALCVELVNLKIRKGMQSAPAA